MRQSRSPQSGNILRCPLAHFYSAVDTKDEGSRSEVQMFLWLGLFTLALVGFGFVWGGPIIVMLFVRFSSKDTWLNAFFARAGTFATLFGVFVWMLELKLFPGLVVQALL
jgi:hypothetical protein